MRTKHVAFRPPRSNSKLKSKTTSEEPIFVSSESAGDADVNMPSSPRHSDRKRKSAAPAAQHQRVWSDEAAEALLRGMMEYRSKTGSIPSRATMADFFDSVKSSLPPEITKDQVYNKIRHLRDRYYTAGGTGVHSSVVQQLLSDIWSTADNKNDETDDGEPSNGDGSGSEVNLGVQLNDGHCVHGGEENGGGDEEVNIISNSPKPTPKKKNKMRVVEEEENHENAPKSMPKKKKKAATEDERDERDGDMRNGKQIPAEKANNKKKQKKVNKATATNAVYNFLRDEIEEDKRKARNSREEDIQESVLCNNYPCIRDVVKEVCVMGGFGSSLVAELLMRIGDEKLEAMEKKYESHLATEMKLRAQLMELNAELHHLLSSSVNRK